MRQCPNCKAEVDPNVDTCPSCGWQSPGREEEEELVHLVTASNDIEAEIIMGLLNTAGITAYQKSVGVDRFVGAPVAGVDVVVPAGRYQEAFELINTQVDEESLEEQEEETESGESEKPD